MEFLDASLLELITETSTNLPPDVRAAHLAARVDEDIRSHRAAYRSIEADRVEVAGLPAYRRLYTYQERNNAEIRNEVLQIVLVSGERAYIIVLETAEGARAGFWDDFQKMMRGFVPRSADQPVPTTAPRRKIRSGELVNPDAIKY